MALAALALNPVQHAALASPRKRVVVVDDSLTILHAICSLLEHQDIFEVVGRAESGPETIEAVTNLHPDVVMMDADMPGMSGLRTALLLSQTSPTTKVVLMSMDATSQFRRACAGCGAYALIYKPKFLSELVRVLENGGPQDWKKSFPRARRKTSRPVSIMR
ncbi:MAG TPA: response regulator transcription factor [Terriglobales bacterium]